MTTAMEIIRTYNMPTELLRSKASQMIQIRVTLRSRLAAPPHVADGWIPFVDCPLAVTNVHGCEGGWRALSEFCITHRPTGFVCGKGEWPTIEAAMVVLLACDPTFPAWALATSDVRGAATVACAYKYRMATLQGAGQ